MPRGIQQSTERNLQHAILEFLAYRKIYAWRSNTGAFPAAYTSKATGLTTRRFIRFGKPGISDILGILPDGKLLAIEVKSPSGGRLRPEQVDFLDAITKNHGVAGMAKSIEDVETLLTEYV